MEDELILHELILHELILHNTDMDEASLATVSIVMHRSRGDWKVTDARGEQPVLQMVLALEAAASGAGGGWVCCGAGGGCHIFRRPLCPL